jgi:hypothetical protein
MAMSHAHQGRYQQNALPQRKRNLLWTPVAVFAAGILGAVILIAWLLWPRWPSAEMSLDAPSLPVTVNGVNFNIPPAAIRNKVQRKPGMHERVDLVFLWPSLEPPDPAVKAGPVASAKAIDRVFLTIANYGNTLPLNERFNTIYPRYLDPSISTGPGGLAVRPFRDGTPYQGEDMLYDSTNPERFLVRCTRDGREGHSEAIGMCLFEKRIDKAELTARFPREWLSEWSEVAQGLEALIAKLRGAGR